MPVSVNFHSRADRKSLSARAGGTQGAPLTVKDADGNSACFFLDDFDLAERLAEAINAAAVEHRAAVAAKLWNEDAA